MPISANTLFGDCIDSTQASRVGFYRSVAIWLRIDSVSATSRPHTSWAHYTNSLKITPGSIELLRCTYDASKMGGVCALRSCCYHTHEAAVKRAGVGTAKTQKFGNSMIISMLWLNEIVLTFVHHWTGTTCTHSGGSQALTIERNRKPWP